MAWVILGVVIAGFIGVIATVHSDAGRLDTKIDSLAARLDGRLNAMTARMDHLTERVEEHLRSHA